MTIPSQSWTPWESPPISSLDTPRETLMLGIPSFFDDFFFDTTGFLWGFFTVLALQCRTGSSQVVASWGYSLVAVGGSSSWCLLVVEQGLWGAGSVGAAPGSRAQAHDLRRIRLVAPQHVGSSQIRDQTRVSCLSKWIVYHWAIREAQWLLFDSRLEA